MSRNDSNNGQDHLEKSSVLTSGAAKNMAAPSEISDPIVRELNGIRHSLEHIGQRLDKSPVLGEPVLTEEERTKQEANKNQNRHASKVALALGFGFLGAKLGGLLGAKSGYLRNMLRTKPENQALEELDPHLIGDLVLFGGAGTLAGAGAGAALGWARGDRIENPGDLISKPIESFQKIIGPAPQKPEEKEKLQTSPASAAPKLDAGWKQHIDLQRFDPQSLNALPRK